MSNLETALLNALKKGDISDPIFRRKVYETAANALQRSLIAKGQASKEALDAQNKQLADAIRVIEADLKSAQAVSAARDLNTPAEAGPRSKTPIQQVHPPRSAAQRIEPEMGAPEPVSSRHSAAPEPSLYAEPRPQTLRGKSAAKPLREPRKSGVRAPYAKMLTAAVLVSFLGIGFFWVFTTDAFRSDAARDTSVPNPAKVLESESFAGRDPQTAHAPQTLDRVQANSDGWVSLFSPADLTTLGLAAGATAQMKTDPFGDYVNIVTPNAEAEVRIDIPLNLMQQAAGRTMQIGFIARSEDGEPTQMSVTCDFGALGDCGRVRFNMGQAPQEYLFQVQFPPEARASQQGILKIVTDIENGGRAVNLLEVRARLIEN